MDKNARSLEGIRNWFWAVFAFTFTLAIGRPSPPSITRQPWVSVKIWGNNRGTCSWLLEIMMVVMCEILECDLLLPNADPSLQKPTAPDIFICQRGGMFAQYSRLAHNKSYIKRYSRWPLPSQRRRQPKQRGEALQVLQATSILDILLLLLYYC